MIRTFSENTQQDNYAIGKSYDQLIESQVERFEKALNCKVERTSTAYITPQLKARLFDLLHGDVEEIEWSGECEGQGNGPHSSGPGPLFAACPVCGGLKEPNGHFVAEAVGHRPDCELDRVLKEARR